MDQRRSFGVDHTPVEVDQTPAAVVEQGSTREHAGSIDVEAIEALDRMEGDPLELRHGWRGLLERPPQGQEITSGS